MEKMLEKNRMSLRAFLLKQNCPIEFVRIKDPKTQQVRPCGVFLCGTVKGYVSEKVMNAVNSNSLKADDVDYAECAKPEGGDYVPCLMIRNKANVVASFSLKDLE